jgi:hypothetical protein
VKKVIQTGAERVGSLITFNFVSIAYEKIEFLQFDCTKH